MAFLRRIWSRHSKLGRKRKNKRNWRKPRGRDNKMREKRRGYPAVVSIGYRKPVNNEKLITIKNVKDLSLINKNKVGKIARVGKKKKIEIAKKADSMGVEISNLNIKKFLKEIKKKEPVKKDTVKEGKK